MVILFTTNTTKTIWVAKGCDISWDYLGNVAFTVKFILL